MESKPTITVINWNAKVAKSSLFMFYTLVYTYACNTIRKRGPSIITKLLQLFNVRLSYMIRPYTAIIRYYIFMLFETNYHKATHFSNNNSNSLIAETTCDSHQTSCHKCVTPPQLQQLFARLMVIFPVSNTVYSTQNVKEGITLKFKK